jgi:hypothetical protein
MSGYSPFWKRPLYRIPGLFKVCSERNYHWRWDTTCWCVVGTNGRWFPERI